MKKIVYIMLLMSNLSFSQKITLNDLIDIHVYKIDKANSILSNKGWDLNEVSDNNISLTSWSYKKSELESTKAKSFITKFYQKEYDSIADFTSNSRTFTTFNLGVRFEFSSSNKKCLNEIMNNIKQYNMKKIAAKFKENCIISAYQGVNYVVEICNCVRDENSKSSYEIKLYDKNNY